jgi:hypothetical protein
VHGLGVEDQPRHVPVERLHRLLERLWRRDAGHRGAAALFAGRDRHLAPVRKAFAGTLGIEFHLGAFAVDRHDGGHAQFGGLLQDQVHLFAARDALQQRDPQWRFVACRRGVAQLDHRLAFADLHQRAG